MKAVRTSTCALTHYKEDKVLARQGQQLSLNECGTYDKMQCSTKELATQVKLSMLSDSYEPKLFSLTTRQY